MSVRNYKSIGGWITVEMPEAVPLVIFGENNAGKSNLASALELVLGERYPGTYRPEDHELHMRASENLPMQVVIDVADVVHLTNYGGTEQVIQFSYRYPSDNGDEPVLTISFETGTSSPYVSNATREQVFCIVIAADRRLSYQLSYTSKWTFLSKLMRKFHEALVSDPERVLALKEHFNAVKELFAEVPEFSAFADALVAQVSDLSGNFEYQLAVDFSAYDPSNYFRSLRVFPCQDGQVRSFDELGTGQEQILAIAFAWAYAAAFHGDGEGLILVVEEPESHLHPLAQRWLSRRLGQLAQQGLQVVVTTHSPAFLDVRNLPGFVRVSKKQDASQVHQHDVESFVQHCIKAGATSATAGTTLQRYSAWSTEAILAGLFSRRCVIVEGPTEAAGLPEFLSRVGYDCEKEGTAFIAVGGVGDLAKWLRFFTAYQIPCHLVFDRDEGEDGDGKKRTDAMLASGLSADDAAEVLQSTEIVSLPRLTMLVEDYESAMQSLLGEPYTTLQDEAREQHGLAGGQAKPLLARYVAERVEMSAAGQAFFEAFARALEELTLPDWPVDTPF